jgi:hypothetical protein
MDLQRAIGESGQRSIAFLDSLLLPERGFGVHRESLWEGGRDFPGMLLPGTYNAVCCRFLLGGWKYLASVQASSPAPSPTPTDTDALAAFLCSFQIENGAFRLPGMTEETIYYPDFGYDDLHVTNYALGALGLLGRTPAKSLSFATRYANLEWLEGWLDRRDPAEPWTEGNYLVNAASLLAHLAEGGHPGAAAAFSRLLSWQDETQSPETGFWADPARSDLVSAMAGAAHNLHLYHLAGRPVPRHERIVDATLGLVRGPATTACLDIDAVDILANLHAYGHRQAEIEDYLEGKAKGVLAFQNPDGGFPDSREGERLFDGWESYREPQGLSNAFATWFRCATIGMAASILFPATREDWRFRNTIGIGYFPVRPARGGVGGAATGPAWLVSGAVLANPHGGTAEASSKAPSGPFAGAPERKAMPEAGPVMASSPPPPPALVAGLLERLALASAASRSSAAGTYSFDLGMEGSFVVLLGKDDARLAKPEEASKPDLTLSLSAADLERLLAGKLNATVAYMKKKLRLRGDIARAFILQGLLKSAGRD